MEKIKKLKEIFNEADDQLKYKISNIIFYKYSVDG